MKKYSVVFVLIIAAVLRWYHIGSVPPALSLDEVSLGYNAYSLLQTGRDEYGTPFPLILRAYDDWRPGLYAYLIIPFVKLFGLTTFSVRAPSVFLSLGCVYLAFILTLVIFRVYPHRRNVALVASFLLAISPWHIYLSRLGHEANLGLFITMLGGYLLIRAFDKGKGWYAVAAAISFAVSLTTYQSQKIISPFMVFGILWVFWPHIRTIRTQLVVACIIGVCISLPLVLAVLSPQALTRFSATSAFVPSAMYDQSLEKYIHARETGNAVQMFFTHRYMVHAKIFITNYVSHFRSSWLFMGNEKEDHKVPHMGLLYWWELALILAGAYGLLSSRKLKTARAILLLWIVIAPLPAAITTQAPHAMRSYTFLPAWQIVGGFGAVTLFQWYIRKAKKYWCKAFLTSFIVLVLGASIGWFSYQYFVTFPRVHSGSFQYAAHQALSYVLDQDQQYRKIVISNGGPLYQSYMFFLFKSAYDPAAYLSEGGTGSGGWAQTHMIGNYEFRPIIWDREEKNGNILYVGSGAEILSKDAQSFSDIDGNGEVLVAAY